MRYMSGATVTALMLSIPFAIFGQVQDLSITNYQLVTSVQATATLWQQTYRVDVVNSGTPVGSVTATAGTRDASVVRIVPTQNTLTFPAVSSNGEVTSTNTFSVLVNPSVPLNTSDLTWAFRTTPPGPVANPGPGQTVAVGANVTLNGSGSTNPSGVGTLTYTWAFTSRPTGSATRLTPTTGVMSGFTVDAPGNYIVTLTVSNGVASNSGSVTISTTNTTPVADAGPDQFVNIGALVQLSGAGSTDVDGNLLSYRWTLAAPPYSAATLSNPTAVNPTFTADLPGTYTAQLVVNDGHSNSAPSTVTITTNPPTVPMAFAGQNRSVPINSTITLDGVGVDPQGKPLLYQWTLLTSPLHSNTVISNPNIPQPTLVVDEPGAYVAQIVVSDSTETSAPSTVTINTTTTPPVANAGTPQTVWAGRPVQLNGYESYDPDGDPLTYAWTFASLPALSSASISGANTVVPTFVPDVADIYVVQLIVSDPYASSLPSTVSITVNAPVAITLTPNPLALSASPATLTVTLSAAAGASGVPVNLTSSNPAAATVPLSVTVPAGATTASVTVTPGSASGTTTITASGLNMTSGTATVNYTRPAAIILSANPINETLGQQATFPVSLSIPAPSPNGVVVTLVSNNSNVKLSSATVTIPAGATAPATQPTISGSTPGTATITASAPGFPPVSQTDNVTETIVYYPTTLSVPSGSSNRYTWLVLSGTAPAGGLTINLSSDNPAVAKVPATVTIPANGTQVQVYVTGVAAGTTTIHAKLLPFIPDTTATVTVP
jgi:hypothetical protein